MIVIMRNREGKAGGGKGPMLGEDKSFTLATFNDQTLFLETNVRRLTPVECEGKGFGEEDGPMYTLDSVSGHGVAVAYDEFNDSVSDTHHTLRAGTKQSTGVMMESTVRRLTPIECERLQGFPDDWTDEQADSHRYKQMGNAVTVNVARWIGSRL